MFSIHRHLSFLFPRLLTILALVCLAACNAGGGSSDSPSAAPTGFTVTPIDGGAIVTWNQDPSLDYWIFYAAANSVTPSTYSQFPQARVQKSVVSPLTISGLTNGTTYAFVMNSTKQGSPAGPATTSIAIVPKPAGTNWMAKTPITTANLRSSVVGLTSSMVAVGSAGTILTSTDLTTWTAQTSGTTSDLNAISVGGTTNSFIAVGANGTILTSTDNVTWTASTSGVTNRLNGVTYANSLFVVVGDGGLILTSSDAATWTAQTSGTTKNLNAISYTNDHFTAVGANGTVLESTDGLTWTVQVVPTTADLNGVIYGLATYLIVGNSGTILSSTDGDTWTLQTPVGQTLYSVSTGTQVVVVGSGGTILYGLPTTSWTVAASGTTSDLRSVYNYVGYTALGNAGANTFSQ